MRSPNLYMSSTFPDSGSRGGRRGYDDEEVHARRVPAGRRTYFFDVKSTRSGDDYFITITESKRTEDEGYRKHKIFLYKEDFGKFLAALHEAVAYVRDHHFPDYDFRELPPVDSFEAIQARLEDGGYADRGD